MTCPQCHVDNKSNRKFCGACGHPLPSACANCGFVNDGEDRFCGGCGSPLTLQSKVQGQKPVLSLVEGSKVEDDPDARPQPLDARPVSYTPPHLAERIRAAEITDGERKTITALFADIQDSTALIEDLDPEAARRLIDPALQLMMDAVHRYEGFVVQPTGDGIFALFGAPIAHEDHPQRALYAALLMQADSKRYAEQLRRDQGINLQIRVGVNTGEVVLRSIRKDDLHNRLHPGGALHPSGGAHGESGQWGRSGRE